TNAEELNDFVQDSQQELAAGRDRVRQAEAAIAANPALESILRPQIVAGQAEIAAGEERLAPLQGLNGYAASQLSNTEGTKVEVRSENISAILGMKLGANKNFQIYGGPVAQRVQADVKLRGSAYGLATGYTSHI